jgi:polyhydroxybutyrate depolymerase
MSDASTGGRRLRLALVLVCVNLPGVVVAVQGIAFYARNRSTAFIEVGGERRGYVLHLPPGAGDANPVPLVISLHGGGPWGAAQRDISGWNPLADREGFIVAYPSGAGRASPRAWHASPGPGLLRDVEFLTRLIDTLVARYGADPRRVYVNGLSNGGGMAFALSCAAPHRIAAVGMVAPAHTFDWARCGDAPPVPAILVHGTADPVTPYRGGATWVSPRPFPDIPAWIARWAERDGCGPTPHDSALSPTVVRRSFDGCAAGADVVLYTVQGDGHVWPGGGAVPVWLSGRDTRSVNATGLMWEFFRSLPRP